MYTAPFIQNIIHISKNHGFKDKNSVLKSLNYLLNFILKYKDDNINYSDAKQIRRTDKRTLPKRVTALLILKNQNISKFKHKSLKSKIQN